MSSDNKNVFTKENLDTYLKELAKEFRKINGKSMPAEIILIGGAAILVNYGFRDSSLRDEMIVRRATKKEMTQYLNNNGFISMQIDGVQKVVMGYTTMDELMRVVDLTSVLDVK